MGAVRLVQREVWERKLASLGCKQVAPKQPLETAEVWETKDGLLFMVPIDNAPGALRVEDLSTVLAQIARLKPTEWE
jgi:hypothetical protein